MPIMAPKVAFPAAFGILIGTCLFKILIPDEELLILKGELLIQKGSYSSIGTTIFMLKLRPIL
jgi:hypothetical protein